MSTRVLLIRHGQSEWNTDSVSDRFNGRTDIPLSQKGVEQIRDTAKFLASFEVAAIYSSPLRRALKTAEIIAKPHHLEVECMPELIEIDFGEWEGLTIEEIFQQYPEKFKEWVADPAVSRVHRGESGYDVAARVLPPLTRKISLFDGRTIAIVAHKVVNRIILCHWLGIPICNYRKFVPQFVGALNVLDIADTKALWVESLNNVLHSNALYSHKTPWIT